MSYKTATSCCLDLMSKMVIMAFLYLLFTGPTWAETKKFIPTPVNACTYPTVVTKDGFVPIKMSDLPKMKISHREASAECIALLDSSPEVDKEILTLKASFHDLSGGSGGEIANCGKAKYNVEVQAQKKCLAKGFKNYTILHAPENCEAGGVMAFILAKRTYELKIRCGKPNPLAPKKGPIPKNQGDPEVDMAGKQPKATK